MPTKPKPKKKARSAKPSLWMDSVAVMVNDRERSKDWYRDRLGLAILSDHHHWVTVGGREVGGAIHLCQVSEAGEGATPEPGNTGILLRVRGNFERACQALRSAGISFTTPPTKAEWGAYAVISDPDGNEIWLMPAAP
jgi:catechol 2,3-dioxygenase-like lactoylglutathione lyase family enzyme